MSKKLPNCRCGNSYLTIRTDIYKDKREFVYCDCCGALADMETWSIAADTRVSVADDAVAWIRNNYQDYPNISSLCDSLRACILTKD